MLYYKIIKNDIRKSKLITVITMLFVVTAAMLVSLAAILLVSLSGSVDTLMNQAKTPHYMQMHAGELDRERLASFAEQNKNVEQLQVVEFLGIDGSEMLFNGQPLTNSVMDNGFCTQNTSFDYLLDLEGNVIEVSDGEVYIPVFYWKDGIADVGDTLTVHGMRFTVAGLLRDSQMNSSLAMSKRCLISENDYAALREYGDVEYLIEIRAKDTVALGALEADYVAAGLESNGPMVTYANFKAMNGLTDGLMAGIILLVAVIVVVIALLCIRFTLLAKIEDDYREIGVMKAIGLRVSDIKKLYLSKHLALSGVGCILGYALSFLFRDKLTENIRLFMGESSTGSLAPFFGALGVLLIFLTIVAYLNGVLGQFRTIPATEALRFGTAQEKRGGATYFRLSAVRFLNTNVFLGVKDVLTRKKLYITMLAVLAACSFIILVPQNISNTISGKSFMTYMGIGNCDFRFDIQQTDNIPAATAEIVEAVSQNPAIAQYSVLTSRMYTVLTETGTEERLKVELGEHDVFPISCSEGRLSKSENEISLSALSADALGKHVGDSLTLESAGGHRVLTVSGIYSDFTNGGITAKAVFDDDSAEIMWSIVNVKLSDSFVIDQVVSDYATQYPNVKITSVNDFMDQMYGATIRSVELASRVALAGALFIIFLVTLLFMKMLIVKDRYVIAVMKASGFSKRDLAVQYAARAITVLLVSILLGVILANTLGGALAGMATSSFGVTSLGLQINPVSAYLLCPLMMTVATLLATMLGTADIGRVAISENIKE